MACPNCGCKVCYQFDDHLEDSAISVAGKPSCSASSANDNQEIGEKIAINNARRELWPLMGYALKEQLSKAV